MTWVGRGLEWLLEVGLHRRRPWATPPFVAEKVRRILVVRKHNIGDVVCTTPALRALRRAFPGAHIVNLVSEHCRAAVDRNPDVDEVLTYTKSKHATRWFGLLALWNLTRVIRDLRARRFDLAIVMGRSASRSGAWLAYASGAPWRLGYVSPALDPFAFFLNLGCDPGAMTSHEVDGGLDLVASIGVPPAGRQLTLVPDPEVQEAVRRRLRVSGIAAGQAVALVHISNRRESSRWPLPAFARAADAIRDRLGLAIVLSWAPGDQDNPLFPGDDGRAEEVAKGMHSQPVLLRTPELAELIAAVSLCDFVLSTDGGLMHIAAALDIPQVVLFGKTGPEHWAPVTEKGQVLRSGGRADRISVDEVVAASVEVMSRWGRGKTFAAAATRGTTGHRMAARGE